MVSIIDCSRYNELPGLAEAYEKRNTKAVDAVVNGPIRDVFLKHVAHLTHCLYLQHRHHEVSNDEAVVKVEGTAHLMGPSDREDIASFGNQILPTTWMTNRGEVTPMEFTVIPAGTKTPQLSSKFIQEFLDILKENNIEDMFGIDTLAKEGWAETKIGDASVVVPSNESDKFDAEKFIPVALAFEEDKPGYRVHGKCGTDHKHSSKPKPKPS